MTDWLPEDKPASACVNVRDQNPYLCELFEELRKGTGHGEAIGSSEFKQYIMCVLKKRVSSATRCTADFVVEEK